MTTAFQREGGSVLLQDNIVKLFGSLIKYGLIGVLTVATQAIVFVMLVDGLRFPSLVSYALAVGASLLVAYVGQSRWTFADRQSRSVTAFLSVAVLSFCIGSANAWLIVDWAGLSPLWALPVMLFVLPLLSFLALRAWAFR